VEIFVCDDGREVPDLRLCRDIEPEVSTNPTGDDILLEEVQSTGGDVISEVDAESAFNTWKSEQGYNYEYVSSNLVSVNGKDYYRVIYRHFEMSGGKRQMFVDLEGNVYEQIMQG